MTCSDCRYGHRILHQDTRDHFWNPDTPRNSALEDHQFWMVETWFIDNWLPMMMMMAEYFQAVMVWETGEYKKIFDAENQLDAQRAFQMGQARAHKNYHPSEQMCSIGTAQRSLASSQRYAELSASAILKRITDRQLMSGQTITAEGSSSDAASRIDQRIRLNCNPADNSGDYGVICPTPADPGRMNRHLDMNLLRSASLTQDMDITQGPGGLQEDGTDITAFAINFTGEPMPRIDNSLLSNETTNRPEGDALLLDTRSIALHQSVLMWPYANIMSRQVSGGREAQPWIYASMQNLGYGDDEIYERLGERPSLNATEDVFVKSLQTPETINALAGETPANVARIEAQVLAFNVRQNERMLELLKMDEIVTAVIAENLLIEEQERIDSAIATAIRTTAQPIP
ncbi:MAG: hypothetical protein AAF569_09095 [Pseudomonadota bacterium]